jgi:hypothetical protein
MLGASKDQSFGFKMAFFKHSQKAKNHEITVFYRLFSLFSLQKSHAVSLSKTSKTHPTFPFGQSETSRANHHCNHSGEKRNSSLA